MIRHKRAIKKRKGFGLIEALIAMVVIAIVSVGAFEFIPYCQSFIANSELWLKAANFGRETMERLYWDQQLEITPFGPVPDDLPQDALPSSDDIQAERSYTVSASADGNYRIINVLVQWGRLALPGGGIVPGVPGDKPLPKEEPPPDPGDLSPEEP